MKNTALVIGFCLATFWGTAQSVSDNVSRWSYGFNLGVNYSNVLVDRQLLSKDVVSNGVGLRLGLLADYKLSETVSISPKAELSFNRGTLDVPENDGSFSLYEVMPISMDFMTHFVFKRDGSACNPYLLIGPKFSVPISDVNDNTTSFETGYNLAVDVGIGFEKAFSFFRISPELRYSFGLLNVNQNPIFQDVKFHNLALVFNFMD
jgi:hypothetical protein